jgi:hypothetical protein
MRCTIPPVFRRTLPWDPVRDKLGTLDSRTMPSLLEISSLFGLGDSDDRFDAPKRLNQEHHETLPFVPRGNHRDTGTFALSAGPPITIPVDPLVLVRGF